MSTEEGTIVKVINDIAWVRVKRNTMCNACKCKSACSIQDGGEIMEAEALNTVNGQEGDRILLNIPSKSLWKLSFVLYMLPVIFLLSGIIIGMKLADRYSLEPELGALFLGVVGCILSIFLIKLFARRVRNNKEYTPRIIKVISTRST